MTTTNNKLPADAPNPDPTYYNCRCAHCNAWLHRQPSVMKPGRNYFCNRGCDKAWHDDHPTEYADCQKKVQRTQFGYRGPLLRHNGVLFTGGNRKPLPITGKCVVCEGELPPRRRRYCCDACAKIEKTAGSRSRDYERLWGCDDKGVQQV